MNTIHPSTSPLINHTSDYNENAFFTQSEELSKFNAIEFSTKLDFNSKHLLFNNDLEDDSETDELLTLEYNISSANKKKRKNRSNLKKNTKANPKITLEIEKLLQKANDAYLEKKFILAIEILEEIVVKAPGLHDPFHMLGLIYEQELEDREKAIGFYLVAAHLVGNDVFLWKRIGQMCTEAEDWNRSIYCYLKCIKNINYSEKLNGQDSTTHLEDEVRFELSNAYYSINDIHKCIQQLKILFWRHPGDPFLGKELARCYHKIGKLTLAADTLESCIQFTEDFDLVNMLCEVYIDLKLYQKCIELIHNFFNKSSFNPSLEFIFSNESINLETDERIKKLEIFIKEIPIDIATKYAVASVNLNNCLPAFFVSKLIHEQKNIQEFVDLHLILGDAYFQIGKYKNANDHYVCIANLQNFSDDILFNIKYAYSLQKLDMNEKAISILKRLIQLNEQVSNDFNVSKAKTLLASIYSKMGHENLSQELIYTMKYEDIVQSRDISKPIPQELRSSLVLDLFTEMKDIYFAISKSKNILPYVESAISPKFIFEVKDNKLLHLSNRFLDIMNEFLLDTKRINQQIYSKRYREKSNKEYSIQEKNSNISNNSQNQINRTNNSNKKKVQKTSIQPNNIRNELGLITLENILTSEKEFWQFLTLGALFLQYTRNNNTAIEIFEKLLNNLKIISPEMHLDSLNKGKRSLQKLLLSLSFEGRLWRLLLGFLREEYNQGISNKRNIVKIIGRILLMPQVFVSCLSNNICYSLEKETISETRSWIQRQITHSGDHIDLLIIMAHLYVLSNRLNQATSEYLKIHRLLPHDDLISLCLGVSLIGIATSKESKNRIFSIIKGFSFITRYIKGRKSLHFNDSLYKAECYYNLARAFHQIDLKTNAITCYLKCMEFLNFDQKYNDYDHFKLQRMSSYNLSLLLRNNSQNAIFW